MRNYPKRYRLLAVCLLLLAAIAAINYFYYLNIDEVRSLVLSWRTRAAPSTLAISALLYLLLLSLPFVPGVELGLLLMGLYGRTGIAMVYLCTVGGLTLAFALGHFFGRTLLQRWLPPPPVSGDAEHMGQSRDRLSGMLHNLDATDPAIARRADSNHWARGRANRYPVGLYRYLLLAALLNLPGNYLLGGGGGIALFCGASRHMRWRGFLLTVILCTAPVPLLAWFGIIGLEQLLGFN